MVASLVSLIAGALSSAAILLVTLKIIPSSFAYYIVYGGAALFFFLFPSKKDGGTSKAYKYLAGLGYLAMLAIMVFSKSMISALGEVTVYRIIFWTPVWVYLWMALFFMGVYSFRGENKLVRLTALIGEAIYFCGLAMSVFYAAVAMWPNILDSISYSATKIIVQANSILDIAMPGAMLAFVICMLIKTFGAKTVNQTTDRGTIPGMVYTAPTAPAAPSAPAAAVEQPAAKPSGRFCTSCGAPLEEGQKFCTACGAKNE